MKTRSGFTLIELMVVIVIIGVLATTATMGFTSIFSKDKDEIARDFVSNIKYLFDRANFTNSYIRIEFDFEKNTYEVSASKDRVLLFGKKREVALGKIEIDDKEKKRNEEMQEEEKKADEAFSSFEQNQPEKENDDTLGIISEHSMKRYKSARFDKIMVDEDLNFTINIPQSVKIAGVYTEYYSDYVTSGKAEIIIFPNNYIQRSVVVFQDVDSDEYVSVLIEPYSGYSEVKNGYYQLSDEEEEVEDDD
jgi:prepilin-type N-terminal cleavage/methylation domain-containing protein